jgi:hypothetical protein
MYLSAHKRLVTEELELVIELVVTQGCGELGGLPQTPRPEVADDLRCVVCERSSRGLLTTGYYDNITTKPTLAILLILKHLKKHY